MVHGLSSSALAVSSSSSFSLSVPSPPSSSRRPSRSHSNASSDRDDAELSLHHSTSPPPPLTPRRKPSASSSGGGAGQHLHARMSWLTLPFLLPSFLSSTSFRPLHRPHLSVLDQRGHAVSLSLSLYLRLLCALRVPVYALLLAGLLAGAVTASIVGFILHANSVRLTYQFTSPPHPLTPHYPVDSATLNRTDAAGRALAPDSLHAHVQAVHELGGVRVGQLEWMVQQASVCSLVLDLCHPKDERWVRYKVVDRHQRRCQLYRVSSAQHLQQRRQEGEDDDGQGEAWKPHLSIVQMADRLPYVLSYTHKLATVVEYAERHGYAYYIRLVSELERRGRHPSFGRALAAYEMLHLLPTLHPHPPPPPSLASTHSSHYLFYLDLDAYINTTFFLHIPLTRYVLPAVDLHFQGEDTFCAAVFLARPSSLSLRFFEHVWAQGLLDYTRRHTWEQKAFTHTLNLLLSGHNAFTYSTHCLTDSCEPLYLRSYHDRPDRLWLQSWGAIGFWPLNRAHSLHTPQVHMCVWHGCPQMPGLVVHNGDHSSAADSRWTPDDPTLPHGTCQDSGRAGGMVGRERRAVKERNAWKTEEELEEDEADFRLQRLEAEAMQPTPPANASSSSNSSSASHSNHSAAAEADAAHGGRG